MNFIKRQPPGRLIAAGFALVILAGAALLMLPVSVRDGAQVTPIDALFTSTSAVCVTGLIAIDTADHFTVFGRTIVALLIQVGGLGVTSVGVGFILVAGKRVGFKSRLLVREAMNMENGKGIVRLVKSILLMTLCFEGAGALFDELKAKDPEAAARMDPHNPRRTIRALEVIEVTGRPYSASLPHYRYVIPTVQIGLDLPREELDRRIDIRTKQMLEGGFIEEVERIRPKLGITAAKALGYQQVVDYLDGLRDLNDTFMDIAQKTKRLARKQMGWFGRDPRIHWLQALNPALLDNAMAIIEHADAGAYDAIDAQADAYTQHHLGDLA